MLINEAFAQTAGPPAAAICCFRCCRWSLIFVVFYFLLIRPQQQKMKAHRAMVSAVKRGDKVLTAGGIYGSVVKIEEADDVAVVEIAKDVRVRVARSTISDVVNKTAQSAQPANDTGAFRRRWREDRADVSAFRQEIRLLRRCCVSLPGRSARLSRSASQALCSACPICSRGRRWISMPSWVPHQQINLGLDLQGGSHLLLEVGVDTVIQERMESVADDIRRLLRPEGVKYKGLSAKGDTTTFTLVDSGQASQTLDILKQLNSNPIAPDFEISQSGGRIDIKLTETAALALQNNAVQQSLEIVRRRIDEVGTREPTIQRQGADRVLVQVPGEKNPDAIKRLLGQTAKLNFHLVDLDTTVAQALSGNIPPGSELMESAEGDGYRPGGGEEAGRGQRREPGQRTADLPAEPAGGKLHLRWCGCQKIR